MARRMPGSLDGAWQARGQGSFSSIGQGSWQIC